MTLDELRDEIAQFAKDRDWNQFHSVRNLVLAMVGEVGEVAEILQWTSDEEVDELLKSGGREAEIEINFHRKGRKLLFLAFAPLKKI